MSALLRVLVCLCCLFCLPATAGSFKVFPLKLTFDLKSKTALFRVTNTGNEAVTVQMEGVLWSQNEAGEDKYEKTRDIILFPKIVEVQKGEERVVRVAYRGKPVTKQERTYRLFAQELPKKGEANSALSFALRFSIPIFITSRNTRPSPKVLGGDVRNGQARILVANNGSRHLVVSEIELAAYSPRDDLVFKQQAKGWYVLPRSKKAFSISLDEEKCKESSWIEAKLRIGRKKHKTQIKVDRSQCRKPKT